jgi:hypothetical protein
MSEVPLTLEELKITIGKNMLLDALKLFGQDNESMQRMVVVAPPAHHIAAAEDWCNANLDKMKVVGGVASRALTELPAGLDSALISIMSDLSNDTDGVQEILRQRAPRIAYIFGILPAESVDDIKKCLEAIVAFCSGE